MLNNEFNIEKKIIFNEPMKNHTSFKIGGSADYFINVKTIQELKDALEYAKLKNLPFFIIGNGSNLLVTDKGIRGLVIKVNIQNIEIINFKDYVEVNVGAGNRLMAFAIELMKKNISGMEELSGIPGTIGGAVYMNAGAYGKEMKDLIISTICMNVKGEVFELSNSEQEFSYRSSIFQKKDYIVIGAKLKLKYGIKEEIKNKMDELLKQRKEKQPIELPSAGSSFKRQEGVITAKLIDECGLKGYQIGGAMISKKHAGFIVNFNNATAKDILQLAEYVKEQVYKKFKIRIEEEIKIIGEE